MTWRYAGAEIHGSKQNPQPGDSVVTRVEDATDPDAVLTREFTWTYDGTQTKGQFVSMVKQEVKAHVRHLNAQAAAGEDVTDLFRPPVD